MSDWRKRLGFATFRGVRFFVEAGERSGGRQTVTHEYPLSEAEPYTEDLGKKGNTFSVTGYVLGTEYVSARDALLTALDGEGPGELVHPYYGRRTVAADTYRTSESTRDGGFCKFSIEFKGTSAEPAQPAAAVDQAEAVTTSASTAKTVIGAQFTAAFSTLTVLRASATAALQSASRAVNSLLDVHAMATQTVADLKRQVDNLASDASALVTEPAELLAGQLALFESLTAGLLEATSGVDPSTALLKLYDFVPGVRPPETTPAREVERENFDAIQRLFQRLALVHASEAAVEQEFASYDDAVNARKAIVDLIDLHTESVVDATFPALLDLRSALVRAVPGDASDLPRIQHVTPVATIPSLVLAHNLYGDLEHEQELIERNRVANPLLVPGGVELEVLSRE